MSQLNNLKKLVDEAYQLFSPYTLGSNFEVCYGDGCCLNIADGALIRSQPLKQLDRRLIYEYLTAVESNHTFALAQQMKYFIPKILALVIDDERLSYTVEITLDKFHLDHEGAWEIQELAFMHKFALEFFQYKALNSSIEHSLDEYVIMFHLSGMNVQFLLDQWLDLLQYHSALISFATMLSHEFCDGFYTQIFAEDDLKTQINMWIREPCVQHKILEFFLEALDCPSVSEEHKQMIGLAADQIV